MKIEIKGRHDIGDLFRLSGIVESEKLNHTPYLVFDVQEDTLVVQPVKCTQEVLKYADDTQVMVQWPGKYRSDYFHFTVRDLREHCVVKFGPINEGDTNGSV